MAIDPSRLTIESLARSYADGSQTPTAAAEAVLSQIKERDGEVHAYLEVFDDVMEQAKRAEERIKNNENVTPLTGVPIAIKDNILIEGRKVSAASRILENYIAPYSSTAAQKLIEAGAVLLGRTNQDEFAMGSSTEHSAFGSTRNPHDPSRVPGGSSGGSAAAVAYGGAVAALGSDTGGSIRQPASYCGIVGLKPTYGSVSRHGLIAMGSSLDVIGPLTRTTKDAEILFNVIRGADPLDSTTLPEYTPDAKTGPLRIGVPRAFLTDGIDVDVKELFEASLQKLQAASHTLIDIDLPHISYSLPAYYVIMPAEASTNLARFDGIRFGYHEDAATRIEETKRSRTLGFGTEVKRRIMLGAYVLSSGYYDAYYGKATAVREVIKKEFQSAFAGVDVIATPTAPSPAFIEGEKADPVSMYLADIFTVSANIAGIPAISLSMGTVARGEIKLPVGIQFMASHRKEATLFQMGVECEKAFE